RVVGEPVVEETTIEALSEQEARKSTQAKYGDTATITIVTLVERGRKGFLGIGRQPDRYLVSVLRRAVVEVTHTTLIELNATIGPILEGEERVKAIYAYVT